MSTTPRTDALIESFTSGMEGCDIIDAYREHARALEVENAALKADVARIAFLEAEARGDNGYPVIGLSVKRGYARDSSEWANIAGTVREAIDRAMATPKSSDKWTESK